MITIKPFLTCALGIALVAAFEIAHNFVDKRWSTPGSKGGWAGLLWLLTFAMLNLSGLMPYVWPDISYWIPMIAICIVHIMAADEGEGFHRLGITFSASPKCKRSPGNSTKRRAAGTALSTTTTTKDQRNE